MGGRFSPAVSLRLSIHADLQVPSEPAMAPLVASTPHEMGGSFHAVSLTLSRCADLKGGEIGS